MIRYCPSCQKNAETYDKWRCPYCKECWRKYSANYRKNHKEVVLDNTRRSWHKNKEKYNLDRKLGGRTLYEELYEKQKGVCAICKQIEISRRYGTLSVDHNHTTGKIRGLLCSNCNRALGLFKDNPQTIESALTYLKETNE